MFSLMKCLLSSVILLVYSSKTCTGDSPSPALILYMPGEPEWTDVLVRRVNDNLTLVCELRGDNTKRRYVWNFVAENTVDRPFKVEPSGPTVSSTLYRDQLQESDSGQYMCSAPPFSVTKYVLVQTKGPMACARGTFWCGMRCMAAQYVCDGRVDCEDGEDEAPHMCPERVCARPDKLNCSTGRCISEAACCRTASPLCQQPSCCDEHPSHSRLEGTGDSPSPALILYMPGEPEWTDVLVRRVNDNLTLVCELRGDNTKRRYVWNFVAENTVDRPFKVEPSGPTVSSTLYRDQLQESDSGQYMCSAPPFSVTKYVLVQTKGPMACARGTFWCGMRCMAAQYVCDGRVDCEDGEDEAPHMCPERVCARPDKLNCSTGRCISEAACCRTASPLCQQPSCCDEHPSHSRLEGAELKKKWMFTKRDSEGNYAQELDSQLDHAEENIEPEVPKDVSHIESPPVANRPVVKRKKDVPTEILNILQQRQKATNHMPCNTNEDDDTNFLMSFRSYIKKMNPKQRIDFQLGMLQLVKKITMEKETFPSQSSYTYSDNSLGSLPYSGHEYTPAPQIYYNSSPSPTYIPSMQINIYVPQNSQIYLRSPSQSPSASTHHSSSQQPVPSASTSKPKIDTLN